MRTRVLIGTIAAAFAVLAVALSIAAGVFIRRFDTIEAGLARQQAGQILQALEADLNQLAISTRDYAEHDDAHRFVTAGNPHFIDDHFSARSLASMQVDAVALLGPDGQPIYSAETRPDERHFTTPASGELLQLFKHLRSHATDWQQRKPVERIAATSRGPMAFAMVKVNRADHSAPTDAVLVFARFFDEDEITRIAQTSQLPVSVLPLTDAAWDARDRLPEPVRSWLSRSDGGAVFSAAIDRERTVSYALVRDIHGSPSLLMSASSPRDIATLGRRTTWMLMGTIALLLGAVGVLLIVFAVRLEQSWQRQHAVERRHRETLDRIDEHDSLTGLPNRVYLRSRLPALLEQAGRARRPLALMYVDLDHFKNINDSLSHGAGDRLLKIISQRLKHVAGADNIVIRSGGDEFVIVASLPDDALAIRTFASRLLNAIREPIVLDDVTLTTTASIGIAVHPEGGADAEALLKHADIALYRAKELGRDNLQLFDPDMNTELSEHVAIEQALRRAIGTEQIYLEFQPLVDLHTGMLTSFEALARWRHPELGQVPPARFIPVAEKSGLIVPLGEQILRIAIKQLHEWQRAGVPLVPVAINVAPLQFERTDFCQQFHELALQHDLDPHWLSIELTESAWMQNSNKHVVMIDTLRHEGSRVYIDDFGTGFSNFSYLKHLPVDAVKIDQAFVRNIDVDSNDAAIVSGILAMARQLNLDTIAEGIETAAQLQILREMGCQRGQGYFFSKPLPQQQCRALLEQMGEKRKFTETLKVRALHSTPADDIAPAA